MKKQRKLICGIVLIALSSLSSGVILGYLAGSRNADEGRSSLRQIRDDLFTLMVRDLKLTPEQQREAGEILDRGMERMVAFRIKNAPEMLMIIKENHQAFRAILTPEQQKDYDAYRQQKLEAIREKLFAEY